MSLPAREQVHSDNPRYPNQKCALDGHKHRWHKRRIVLTGLLKTLLLCCNPSALISCLASRTEPVVRQGSLCPQLVWSDATFAFAGGRTTGEIWVGGRPRDQATAVRISGYVQQTDVLSAYATVQETLMFSARMRMPADLSPAELAAFVEEVGRSLCLHESSPFPSRPWC